MKKITKAFFVSIIIALFLGSSLPTVISQSSDEQIQAQVGIFYYVWYDTTNPESWDGTIVDTPVLGRYDSNNSTIISQHLRWIEDLGVDFVIVSWWGTEDNFGNFTDQSAKEVFKTAQSVNTNLKFAIMVEPFSVDSDSYNYQKIYDQIYNDFVMPNASLYYVKDGNPLICFYNDPGNIPSLCNNGDVPLDERFNTVLVGTEPYTQWVYQDLVLHVSRDNMVSVTPRFDESRLAGRAGYKIDPRLNLRVYDQEWQKAIQLWKEGKIETILISTWNEFYERTAIEPQIDATAINRNPYFLYTKTKNYIAQLRQAVYLSSTPPPSPSPSPSTDNAINILAPSATAKPTTLAISTIPEYPYALTLSVLLMIAATASLLLFKNKQRKTNLR